jgi:hypothetical protein
MNNTNPMTMRSKIKVCLNLTLIITGVLTTMHTPAQAASFSYAITLTPTTGTIGGTGVLTLTTAIPLAGSFYASQGGTVTSTTGDLTGLTINMSDGYNFSLAQENGSANVDFYNGILENFSYDDNAVPPTPPSLGIGGTNYQFSVDGNYSGASYASGNVSVSMTPLATAPEPATPMFAGAALMCLFLWRSVGRVQRRTLTAKD